MLSTGSGDGGAGIAGGAGGGCRIVGGGKEGCGIETGGVTAGEAAGAGITWAGGRTLSVAGTPASAARAFREVCAALKYARCALAIAC